MKNDCLYIILTLINYVLILVKEGIYHGDIKGVNIAVTINNQGNVVLKLIDFGMATD